MNTNLAKTCNKLASHNPKNFRAEAREQLLKEKAAHWVKTHSFVVGNVINVTMPNGETLKADYAGAIDLLVKGWSQYRESN